VQFVQHNLISDEFPCIYKNIFAFDIIMCRNVMIYFDEAKNHRLAEHLNTVLVDDGWLFTGPADFNPRLDQIFKLEKLSGALVYRRCPRVEGERRTPGTAGIEFSAPRNSAGHVPVERPRSDSARSGLEGARHSWTPAQKHRAGRSARPITAGGDEPPPSASAQPSIETIVALANKGEWETAAHYCEAFLRSDTCNAAAHYYYALVLQYSGAAAAAEKALKRAIYLDRDFALAHYQLGLVRKDARAFPQCSRSFRNAINALRQLPDDHAVSPCGQVTAHDLRELATQQLQFLERS
jgi:chemotaxis protein methyltransferase CheR